MTEKDQIQHFADELDALVNRFRLEYELSYASVVGALFLKSQTLCQEAQDKEE